MEKEKQNFTSVSDLRKSHSFTILPKGHSFIQLEYCTIEVTAIKEVMYHDTIFDNAVQLKITDRDDECTC